MAIVITKTDALIIFLLLVSYRDPLPLYQEAFLRATGVDLKDFETNTLINLGYNMKLSLTKQTNEKMDDRREKDEL
jgi:hypothetical protein